MKTIHAVILAFFIIQATSAQLSSVGAIAGGGVTIVDVEKVLDPYTLSDWNTWSMVFKGYAEYQIGEGKALGLEAGTNRLYYWEYQAPGYSWYNWRTEWTTNAVFYFRKELGSKFFIQSGLGVHIFHNGTVAGLMAGGGTMFQVGEKISIPLFVRIEPIFGSATPVAINIGTGARLNLKK